MRLTIYDISSVQAFLNFSGAILNRLYCRFIQSYRGTMSYALLAVATVRSLLDESPCYGDDRGQVKTVSIKEDLCLLGPSFANSAGERLPVCQHGEVVGKT